MIFIAGISPKFKVLNQSNGVCPVCGKSVNFNVSKKYSVVTLFFIPIIPFGASYYLDCPNCKSIMSLSKAKGKKIEQGSVNTVNNSDMEIFQNNVGSVCTACGAKIIVNQNFCYHCGTRLKS